MCNICNTSVVNALSPAFEQLLKKHDNRLFETIFKGDFIGLIDVEQTTLIAKNFAHNIAETINISSENKSETFAELQNVLTENASKFSVFKNAKYLRELQLAAHAAADKNTFLQTAKAIAKNYNQNYLATETAWAQRVTAQSTRWQDIQNEKERFPLLQFHTRNDERVRFKHSLFNGKLLPIDSPFWKMNYPPIYGDWGCRCFVTQEFEGDVSTIDKKYLEVDESRIAPAISNKIFDEKTHPYFKDWSVSEKFDLQKQFENLNIN